MQSSCQFAVAAKLDVDFFVEREPHKVERFRHLWREYALVKCRDGRRRRARMSVSTRGRGAVQRHLGRLSLPFFHPYRAVCSCTPLRREPTLNLTHSLFFLFWPRHPAVDLQRCWVAASAVLPTPLLLSRRCTVAVSAVHRCSPSWLHTSGQPAIPLESVEDRETKAAKHPDGAQRDIMLGQAGGRPCLKAGKLQFISGFPK